MLFRKVRIDLERQVLQTKGFLLKVRTKKGTMGRKSVLAKVRADWMECTCSCEHRAMCNVRMMWILDNVNDD